MMNKIWTLCLMSLLVMSIPAVATTPNETGAPPVVIAHYAPDMGAYGNTVAGYKRDIQDAQAAGVDGFALDMLGWGPNTASWANYQQLAGYMFQAASELGTGFKLFFMLECQNYGYDAACQSAAASMLQTYANHPNYLKYQGRPLFTAWNGFLDTTPGSADQKFWTTVANNIRATGLNPFFIPNFSNWTFANPVNLQQSITNTENWFTTGWLNTIVQGIMGWGMIVPPLAIENNNAFTQVMANRNLTFIPMVESWHAPIRFLSEGQATSVGSQEFNGGEGLASLWRDIITNLKPPMVYLVTWNDYTETYMGPASQSDLTANNLQPWQVTGDYLWTHAAYTDLNKYFIQWYKTGVQPTWPDSMYVFYRNAPMSMKATQAPAGQTIIWNQQGVNPTLDDVYVTTILTAPATLTVSSGGKVTMVNLNAGVNHTRVPFTVGAQSFVITRNCTTLIHLTGANIVSTESHYYNVNPLAYFAHYNPTASPN